MELSILTLVLGCLASLLLGAACRHLFALRDAREASRQLSTAQTEAAAANASMTAAKSQLEQAQQQLEAERRARREADIAEAEAKARAQSLTQLNEELKRFAEASREQLENSFGTLSKRALAETTESFLQLATQSLKTHVERGAGDLDVRKKEIEGLVMPLKEALAKLEVSQGEIEKSRQGAYSELKQATQSLSEQASSLGLRTHALATALRGSSQARGRWGEAQLQNVIELAGMAEHCDFEQQAQAGEGRPDITVRLPGGKRIAIDAKAPLTGYLDAASAETDEARAAALARYGAAVRSHVRSLAGREYWKQLGDGVDLVVMFLPGDNFLAAALAADPELLDLSLKHKVVIVAPATLLALLRTCAIYWQQSHLARNAEEVGEVAKTLHERVVVLMQHVEKVGGHLGKAIESYNKAVGSYESRVLPMAQRVQELGGTATAARPAPELDGIDVVPRRLAPPE